MGKSEIHTTLSDNQKTEVALVVAGSNIITNNVYYVLQI